MADYPYNGPWPSIRQRILDRDNNICQIQAIGCEHHATDVDHIIPWSEGGPPYDSSNLRAACARCNRTRGATRTAAMAHVNKTPAPTPSRDWFTPSA